MIVAGILLLSLIILVVLWTVFVPIDIRVNTAEGLYQLRQPGTLAMSLHPGEMPLVRMRIFGFPVKTEKRTKVKVTPKKKQRARRQSGKVRSIRTWLQLFKGMLKSIRCRRFICRIDFDDVVLNAQLYPLGQFVSHGSVVLDVNFQRKNFLDVWIQARMYRMLWAFARFYLTKS